MSLQPLFSTSGDPYLRRRIRRSVSTESDDELYVDRSLPASPTDPVGFGSQGAAGPSRAYQFAVEDEEILRHASQAFDEEPLEEIKIERRELEDENGDDDLREIQEYDGDYANVDGNQAGPVPIHGVEDDDDEEPPDERQCRICFSGQEEEATMGRLISPCLCSGSMRVSPASSSAGWSLIV
jgi:hypothetical protein